MKIWFVCSNRFRSSNPITISLFTSEILIRNSSENILLRINKCIPLETVKFVQRGRERAPSQHFFKSGPFPSICRTKMCIKKFQKLFQTSECFVFCRQTLLKYHDTHFKTFILKVICRGALFVRNISNYQVCFALKTRILSNFVSIFSPAARSGKVSSFLC